MEYSTVDWISSEPGPAALPDGPEGTASLRPQLADVGRLGRRVVRGVVRAARAEEEGALSRRLRQHLGEGMPDLPVVEDAWRPYDHVNVQTGLDAWLAEPGRSHELLGVAGYRHMEFGMVDLLAPPAGQMPWMPRLGNVPTVNQVCGPDGAAKACVVCGVYLVSDGEHRVAILLRGADAEGMRPAVTVQVVSDAPERAGEVVAEIRALTLEHNVYRGHVLSFGGEVFETGRTFLSFHRRPTLQRRHVILPEPALAAIDRHVVGIGARREVLVANGQHLKRGLLLYGPPGTGKTHTVRYLQARLEGTTILLLTGEALHLVAEACSIARSLQPAVIVVEDVDLIAEHRGMHPGRHPMLFQLLNEMDGLAEDADVVFVLTTNRADLLEPALAARPGRVDQAVELDLPDEDARRRLVELYRGALVLDEETIEAGVHRTEGVTASFIKELLRRAAVVSAEEGGTSEAGAIVVSRRHMDSALDELLDTRNAMTRVLLGSGAGRRHAGLNVDLDDDLDDDLDLDGPTGDRLEW